MHTSYIGITGFTAYDQVRKMQAVFKGRAERGRWQIERKLHVGVMMSYHTLRGIGPGLARARSFPAKEAIKDIFASDETINCLHYADYAEHPDLGKCLNEAIRYGGDRINALQLDMTWPDPSQIAYGVHLSNKDLEIILQVGESALQDIGNDPSELVEKLWEYRGVIHRVLLDKSMGNGRGMNAAWLLPFARAVRRIFPEFDIVVAGGLGPRTMDLAAPLIREFPDLSVDAQGKLCPVGNSTGPLQLDLGEKYIAEALGLFKSFESFK